MKKYFWILAIVFLLIASYFLGTKIAGVLGIVLVALGLKKSSEEKAEKAKENINKAGDEYEATEHDADSALDKLDDIVSDSDSK